MDTKEEFRKLFVLEWGLEMEPFFEDFYEEYLDGFEENNTYGKECIEYKGEIIYLIPLDELRDCLLEVYKNKKYTIESLGKDMGMTIRPLESLLYNNNKTIMPTRIKIENWLRNNNYL